MPYKVRLGRRLRSLFITFSFFGLVGSEMFAYISVMITFEFCVLWLASLTLAFICCVKNLLETLSLGPWYLGLNQDLFWPRCHKGLMDFRCRRVECS